MWQKFVAAIMCMTGACGFGLSLCKESKRTLNELKIEKQMLSYIIGEISYIHRPLTEIFDFLAERVEKPFCLFLKRVSDKMGERNGKSLKDIWNEEMVIFYREYGISKKSVTYLGYMADNFECEGDRIQVEALELLSRDIEREIEAIMEKNKENDRLIRVLSTLAGIMCIVLFL